MLFKIVYLAACTFHIWVDNDILVRIIKPSLLTKIMHVAIKEHELPTITLKSISLLSDGVSYTRGEAMTPNECDVVLDLLGSVTNGDIIDFHLRASNGKLAEGRARINRIFKGGIQPRNVRRVLYAFELEPITDNEI